MAMHLFSTPTECTNCGTVVEDPTLDRCPNCQELLKERRTPRRLAGVEKRYGGLRVVLGLLRFLGVITAVVSVLVFLFGLGDDDLTLPGRLLITLGMLVTAAGIFAIAAFFDVALDIEENTRAAFRMQQLTFDHLQAGGRSVPAERATTQA